MPPALSGSVVSLHPSRSSYPFIRLFLTIPPLSHLPHPPQYPRFHRSISPASHVLSSFGRIAFPRPRRCVCVAAFGSFFNGFTVFLLRYFICSLVTYFLITSQPRPSILPQRFTMGMACIVINSPIPLNLSTTHATLRATS